MYDSAALRAFVGIDLGREPVPDATTILKFRHLLEKHDLGQAIFAEVGRILQGRGLRLSAGTIVDATIIAAPSSTKNAEQQRDPEMRQTKKGNQWHFGMKVHIGADSKTGLVHSAVVTSANVHDKHPLPDLLHGSEKRVYGDRATKAAPPSSRLLRPRRDFTNRRVRFADGVDEAERLRNRTKSRTRPGSSIRSSCSSVCGASPRFATAAWPRTPTGRSRRWQWSTCTSRPEERRHWCERSSSPRRRQPTPPSSSRTQRLKIARVRPPRAPVIIGATT